MRIVIVSCRRTVIHIRMKPSKRLIVGKEKARGTGRTSGSFENTGTYDPIAIPDAAKIMTSGAASVVRTRYPGT